MKLKYTKLPRGFLKNPIHLIAIGFGSGLSPIMPGTCGTLVAIPIYLLLKHLYSCVLFYQIAVIILILISFWICGKTAKDLGEQDPSCIVFDEIVGFLFTMFLIPENILGITIGFIFFRIFDMWKPWPISWVNKNVHGGFGIVIDDIMAAALVIIIFQIFFFLFFNFFGS